MHENNLDLNYMSQAPIFDKHTKYFKKLMFPKNIGILIRFRSINYIIKTLNFYLVSAFPGRKLSICNI